MRLKTCENSISLGNSNIARFVGIDGSTSKHIYVKLNNDKAYMMFISAHCRSLLCMLTVTELYPMHMCKGKADIVSFVISWLD